MRDWPRRCVERIRSVVGLWVLLAGFLCLGAALMVVNAFLMFGALRSRVSDVCVTARNAYQAGGAGALRFVLEGAQAGPGIRVHLLDSSGRDLDTGQPQAALLAEAQASSARQLKPALIFRNPVYSCIAEPPPGRLPVPLGPMFWVLPFVSVVCCSIGGYVTWRMRNIENVLRNFGSGDLAVRAKSAAGDSIGRLSRSFNQMADRIQSLVASHQRLCGDMAHELRSPLTRLRLAIPMARHGATEALDRIEMEAGRVSQLIEELLEIAHAEADPNALHLDPVDVEALILEIADQCSIEAAERGCDIQVVNLCRGGMLLGDGELLRRAVENVVRNAIRHTPEGTHIQMVGRCDETSAVIAVRDWGPGVPGLALEKIFDPFYRLETPWERRPGGAGLGLAIAQRAIAVHRGSIRAENCAPGLRVTIRLPRGQPRGNS